MQNIVLKNIKKEFDNGFVLVQNLNLEVAEKEFFVLVGPSGCGKSTTLRMIAGLEKITDGEIFIKNRLVNRLSPKSMPKPEIEFKDYDTSYEWRPVEGDTFGIKEKILSYDSETGDYARMLKFPPGIETEETLVHDFWEEVLIIEGSLYDIAKKETYLPGFYACRPPGMIHGPYKIPYGCVTFEIRYYKK